MGSGPFIAKANLSRISIVLALVLLFVLLVRMPSAVSWGPGPDYRNYSVRTTVVVTDAYPEILNVSCGAESVVLVAGSTQKVICIVQIRDYNGGDTINGTNGSMVNGTFYYYLNYSSQPDDDTVHYTNSSCELNGTANGFYVNWSCAFDVWYYANNGTWFVNTTVLDTNNQKNLTATQAATLTIGALYAINVTPVIDFGELYAGQISADAVEANITNLGNMLLNVSLYAFGGEDPVVGDGLAMICTQRNLTLQNERYSLDSATAFASMAPVTDTSALISGLTIDKQVDPNNLVVNSTYWRLYINETENPFGECNGTVVFSAEAP